MSECLGKLVQRQAAVEICPLSVLQPELAPDLCPTLRSGQHVAKQHTKKKKTEGQVAGADGGGWPVGQSASNCVRCVLATVSTESRLHNSLAR